jgi:hypothetical protein
MAVIPRRKLESALLAKGFREAKGDRDHRFYFFYYQGKKTIVRVKISTGTGYKDYGDELIRKVKSQLRLISNKQLFDFAECQLSENNYIAILKNKDII